MLLSLVESVNVFDDCSQPLSRSLADVAEATDQRKELANGILLTQIQHNAIETAGPKIWPSKTKTKPSQIKSNPNF